MSKKTLKFKTEVQQLLDLVVHSLYSKKEIFLRELISNASDALDRLQFEALTDKNIQINDEELKIKIIPDEENKTLTIRDNGIGMTADEVKDNIGTIANSGTRRFLEELKNNKDAANPELIGQFGVGFYASFMVADKVTVLTKRAGSDEPAVLWSSSGTGSYSIEEAEKESHGTDIILHLREGMENYLKEYEIRHIVKEYSDYISYPIVMDITRTEKAEKEGDEDVTTTTEETLNTMKAIWKKNPSEVSEEEYNEFYKHVSHDYTDPLRTIHYKAEGVTEFQALVYIPGTRPFDLFMPDAKRGLHLYVRNVLIDDANEDLLPPYLRFIKGVVDSSDLPLNVSREMLQDDAIIRRIKKNIVSRILNELETMKNKELETYLKFYEQFGIVLKEGVHSDFENYDKLKELLFFASSKSEEGRPVSLKEYVEKMPDEQKEIYYLTAESINQAAQSPHLEVFNSKGYEVLFLVDPIDEWVAQRLTEYDGKKLRAIDRGDVDISSEQEKEEKKKALDEAEKKYEPLLKFIKEKLADDIKEVKLSQRLTDSASCLVADEMGMNANMERILKAMNQDVPPVKRILELNPEHPVVEKMLDMLEKDKNEEQTKEYAELLYYQALLAEGSKLKEPQRFTRLISKLMA